MTKLIIEINHEAPEFKQQIEAINSYIKKLSKRVIVSESNLSEVNEVIISVLLTNDDSIRQLNHDFRGKDKATNVLSFPMQESLENPDTSVYLGDIALSYETVADEAVKQNKSFKDHFTHLYIHGMLHLMGYDHEHDQDAEIMEAKEIAILKDLGIGNPYDFKLRS